VRRWIWVSVVLIAGCTASAPLPSVTAVGTSQAAAPTTITSPPTIAVTDQLDDRAEERVNMVEQQLEARDITDADVLAAMRTVPRHRFVPDRVKDLAYSDSALPIGHGQTISQPYIVGLMSQALGVEPGDKVLEIGTGSGYQAAVLAAMGCEVYTMEIISELATRAESTLTDLGYSAMVANADGYFGWEEHAPFDGIIVTAAPDHVPEPLVAQLGEDAALVIPIGPIGAAQTMWRFTVDGDGLVTGENLGGVLFVPFTRTEG
jgi:protein-L-isoaspartate(D-aspartate) O-methyltransferase